MNSSNKVRDMAPCPVSFSSPPFVLFFSSKKQDKECPLVPPRSSSGQSGTGVKTGNFSFFFFHPIVLLPKNPSFLKNNAEGERNKGTN